MSAFLTCSFEILTPYLKDMTSLICIKPICAEVIPIKPQSVGQYQNAITNKNSANTKLYL